ncbi:13684_t:CDS:10 [Dentiscutata erythropus]|uniref:13684_t:CDS:1 n=1 Tax=Dentiscutata erythropus TaxID=1348616 RepID=A0A9N8VXG7_9GLOM|nr:13684_t:CDS:10 [Dentiscutata erythropus]
MAGKYEIIANTSDTIPNMNDSSNIEEDPTDLCTKIPNLYHLLDLRKDMGLNGFAVDKIIISQNSLKKLCNIIVPNSFKSISEINYASLNSKSLNFTGIYGTRESIAKYLLQSNLIDEQMLDQKKVRNTELTLPPSFPSAMSIESCHHQSFLTCHINEPQEISECYERTDTDSGLQYSISEYLNRQDYSLQISSSIGIDELFDLAYILQIEIEEKLLTSYEEEIQIATDDNNNLVKDEDVIIAVDSKLLTDMFKNRLQSIYGQSFLSEKYSGDSDEAMDDSEHDRIEKDYSDVINKLESSIKDINSPKWKEYKKRFLTIQKSVENSANQEKQPLITIIYHNLLENKENKSNNDKWNDYWQNIKGFHKKLLKITDQEDISEISDQQFIQSYLYNKEFDNNPDIKEKSIELFYNEYSTWRDAFLNSISDHIKESKKFQTMFKELKDNLESRIHEIEKGYIKKLGDIIRKKYSINGSNRFVVKKLEINNVSKMQKFKLEFELIKKRPSLITITIYETQIDSEDVQNLFEDPNYVPTPQLQQRVSNIGSYYYGQEFYFNSSKYIFKKVFQLKSRHILLFLWNNSTNLLELFYGQIQQRRNFKPLKEFRVLKENTLIDINEPLGLILLYETKSTRLSVYKFLENPFEVALHLKVDRLFEDNYAPDILKVIFIQCTENFCFIEKNGKAKLFSGKTKQFLLRKLEFPSKTLNALSSPDGTCIVAFTYERQKSKAYIYFGPNFERALKFQRATKISLGHAKPLKLVNDYSEILGDKTSFQSDFEVGDYIIIENEKKLITEISSDDRLKIEAPQLYIFLDFEQALSFKENFENYIIKMLDRIKMSTQKPATILNNFKINVNHYQDLFDNNIIRQYTSKFKLGEWIIQARLCMIIKDVPKHARKEIKKEFEQKFQQIVAKEGIDNFISRIYSGEVDIYAWPMFNDMTWYTTLDKVKEKLDKRESTYDNAHYFIDYIKSMLAKLMVCDWSPLDEAIVYRRVSTLKRLLDSAINMGIEQTEPFVHELLDRSTGAKIPEPEKLIDNFSEIDDLLSNNSKLVLSKNIRNAINNSPLPKDSLLVLYKNGYSLVDISRHLISFFEKHIMERKSAEKDEIWFNNLRIFLDYIVKRRINRVKSWYTQNTASFSQDNSHIIQGNNLLLREISKLTVFWNLCGIKCSICKLYCLKQRDHNNDHDCLTDHKCHFDCQFDEKHLEQKVPKEACKHEAGHDGKHICDKIRHECGEPCYLSDKKNCNQYCTNEVGHSKEVKHKCNSVHQCGAECSLKINTRYTQYTSESCPIPCPMPTCKNKCKSKNHHHALEGAGINHLCGNEHPCPKECESPRICRAEIIEQKAVYHGLRSNIDYTKFVQIKKRLPCSKKIPANKTFHDGPHIHLENAMHTCECTLPYGHTGLHYTTHGNMNLTVFVAEDDDFEYRGNKPRFGSESRKYRNHFEDKEDGVRHIHDPYTALEQEDFAKCDHECPDEIHQKSIDGLPPEKSYCDLQLFHNPISTLPIGKKGYLSNDGHVFLCRDPRVAAFHVIFVLDRSSSMSLSDHPPTSDSRFGRSLQENFNNRLGAALQATDQFIKTRISSTQNQNKTTTIVNVIVSVILFDRHSEVLFENKSIFDTDFIQNKLIEKGTGRGTRFGGAIKKTEEVIDKYFDISRLNVVMFLSDGEEHFPENELVVMCRKNKDKGSPIFFNTIHFGHSSSGAGVLQKMAETAQTYHDTNYSNNNMQCKFVRAPDTICLIDNFTDVAISLLVHKPILMQG